MPNPTPPKPVNATNYRLPELRNPENTGGNPVGPSASLGGIGGGRVPGYTGPMVGSAAPGAYSRPSGVGLRVATRFAEGGSADMAQDKALIKKAFRQHDAQEHKGSKGTKLKLAKGGKVKKMAKGGSASSRADGCCSKGKTKGRFV